MYFVDRDRRITYWNASAERLSGFSSGEVIGKRCMDNVLMHTDERGRILCTADCPLARTISDGQPREAEVFLRHREGHRVPVRIRTSPISDDAGRIIGAVEVFSNNSAKVRLAEQLVEMERQAHLDPLTQLANRRFVESNLHARLEEYRRNLWRFGILFIDIDHFKNINDTYGHAAGDSVLRMVGRSLDACSRYFDTLGRWGGDEFLAIIVNAQPQNLAEVGERFRALVERSELVDPPRACVTISIGGVVVEPDDTVDSLILRADRKLYEAKQGGRNRICIQPSQLPN